MKLIFNIKLFLLFSLILSSCTSEKNESTEGKNIKYNYENEELYHFEIFKLSPFGIPATIYLPDETANIGVMSTPEVRHEIDGFEWEIECSKNFIMKIEDWGDMDGMNVTLRKLEEKKKIYDIKIISQASDFLHYSAVLKGQLSNENEMHHLFSTIIIDDIHYLFGTTSEGISEKHVEFFKTSLNSIKEFKS